MTDLATRIADGRKKAEMAKKCWWEGEWYSEDILQGLLRLTPPNAVYVAAASPSLFIEMADEIDRLTAEIEKARQALAPFAKASTSYSTNRDHDQYCVDEWGRIEAGHLRTAARVHAELTGEKETPSN